ncbi:MAG: hypothetical protein RIQ60_2014 [Pseudomonadota bacterium]|jgi:hypothetical protein
MTFGAVAGPVLGRDPGALADLLSEAADNALFGWEHAFGQTSSLGNLLLTCIYGALALLALAAARPVLRPPHWHARWLVAGVVLAALAALTLLRLDLLFVLFMRSLARSQGWYAHRGPTQTVIVLAFVALVVAGIGLGLARLSPQRVHAGTPQLRLGLGLLVLVGGLRVISLHQVDRLLAWSIGGLSIGRIAEACGLLLVALAVWPALRAR